MTNIAAKTLSPDQITLIRTELAHILESPEFCQAERLRRFICYVVDKSMDGKTTQIKAYTIAVEAFDKPSDFDSQDPYIRNIAKDVRKSLNAYYGKQKIADIAVRIGLPKGKYIATFSFPKPSDVFRPSNSEIRIGTTTEHPPKEVGFQHEHLKPVIAIIPPYSLKPQESTRYIGEVFADDVINRLNAQNEFHVISRLSTSAMSHHQLNVADVRTKLGADYILCGSYLADKEYLRLHTELVETSSGFVVFSEQTKQPLNTLLRASEQWAVNIINRITSSVMTNELSRANGQRLLTLPNYTLLIAATNLLHRVAKADLIKAKQYLATLIDRNIGSPLPYAWMAKLHVMSQVQGLSANTEKLGKEASEFTNRALEIDSHCALALTMDGLVHTNILRQLDTAEQRYNSALECNPNEPLALLLRGTLSAFKGDGKNAMNDVTQAMKLSPMDPLKYYYLSLSATAALSDYQYETALSFANKPLTLNPHHASTLRAKAIAEINLEKTVMATDTIRTLLTVDPDFTVSKFLAQSPSADFAIGLNRSTRQAYHEAGIIYEPNQ